GHSLYPKCLHNDIYATEDTYASQFTRYQMFLLVENSVLPIHFGSGYPFGSEDSYYELIFILKLCELFFIRSVLNIQHLISTQKFRGHCSLHTRSIWYAEKNHTDSSSS